MTDALLLVIILLQFKILYNQRKLPILIRNLLRFGWYKRLLLLVGLSFWCGLTTDGFGEEDARG